AEKKLEILRWRRGPTSGEPEIAGPPARRVTWRAFPTMMPDMLRARVRADMSAASKKPPGSIAEELIVWGIAALGFLAVACLAWLRLPVALWHWANAAWWHWAVAIFAFWLLLLFPLAFILLGQRLITAAGSNARAHLRWATVSYLGALALIVLILLPFAVTRE